MQNVVEKIASKSASLPADLQHEILDFVEFVSVKRGKAESSGKAFKSARGILNRDLSGLDDDLTEIRREMWGGFPREESR